MIDREGVMTRSAEIDQAFDDLVCDVSAKLEAGKAVDLVAIGSEYPEHIDRLRKLLPTLHGLHRGADARRTDPSPAAT